MKEYSPCGKYILLKKIDTFTKLKRHFENNLSVYCRRRPYPVAFLQNWSYRLLSIWMKKGWIRSYKKSKN